MTDALKIRSVIVCDDIRKEANGKEILIGVLAGVVNVPCVPIAAPTLGIRIEFISDRNEINDFIIEMRNPGGDIIFAATGSVKTDNTENSFIVSVVSNMPVIFNSTGIYKIFAGSKDSVKEVYTLRVELQKEQSLKPVGFNAPSASSASH